MDRRRLLASGASAAVLAGCGGGAEPPWPSPSRAPDWAGLSSRLQGQLLRPDSPGFADAAPVYNTLFDSTVPAAVVRCASAADVALALRFARRNGLAVAPRSGGHGYTGDSTGAGLVIDTGPLASIAVDLAAGTATVGAGAKLVDIYDQLARQGVCIPSGTCPTIGIAGITLGGGIGVVDRAYGLTCDRLVSADVVLADGRLVTCDASHHADLFWALRGGGGGQFGIVTAMTFATFPTADLTSFTASFAWSDAAAVFAAWQAWPATLPDTAWSALVMGSTGVATPSLQVSGWYIGSPADFAPLWSQFLAAAAVPPAAQAVEARSFRDAMLSSCKGHSVSECHLASETPDGVIARAAFVASSDFFDTALPPAGVQALLDAVAAQQGQRPLVVILDLMGGAIARVAPDATAFVHRQALFSAQYYLPGVQADQAASARAVATGLRTAMSPWSSGEAYQNYPDAELADWPQAYYGANWTRLTRVKATYDPRQVFRPLQAIPPG